MDELLSQEAMQRRRYTPTNADTAEACSDRSSSGSSKQTLDDVLVKYISEKSLTDSTAMQERKLKLEEERLEFERAKFEADQEDRRIQRKKDEAMLELLSSIAHKLT